VAPVRPAADVAGALVLWLIATPALAQDDEKAPRRTRIALGPQIYPSYPGSDNYDVGPMLSIDRARGDEPFEFEAPDESFGFSLLKAGGFSIGPVANYEGKRTAKDVGVNVPKVKFSLEAGGFAAMQLGENFRLRGEIRKGLTGHKGWIGLAGADAIFRDGDRWLVSIGPRLTWSDNRYQDTWFGVTQTTSVASGVPAFDPDGGIQAYGAAASFVTQFSPRWGLYSYAKYDRLSGDAAKSPLVLGHGSRDQFSGGGGLTYPFGRGVR
jgi:outer membrane scaffolding protein for murein synthesis (MipA/OmpV family)